MFTSTELTLIELAILDYKRLTLVDGCAAKKQCDQILAKIRCRPQESSLDYFQDPLNRTPLP